MANTVLTPTVEVIDTIAEFKFRLKLGENFSPWTTYHEVAKLGNWVCASQYHVPRELELTPMTKENFSNIIMGDFYSTHLSV